MKCLVCAIAVLLLPASLAFGQVPPPMFKAEIPFEFYVGNQAMPAGTYELKVAPASTGVVVFVRRTDAPGATVFRFGFVGSAPMPKSEGAVLAFLKYDNDHTFLRQLIHGGSRSSVDFSASRTEREHVTSRVTESRQASRISVLASLR